MTPLNFRQRQFLTLLVLTAELRDLQEALPALLAPEDADAGALVQAKLYAVLRKFVDIFPDVRSISLLHPTRGRVLLSTDRRLEIRERRDEEYFRAGRQALYISPVA